MQDRNLKDTTYAQLARLGRALGNPRRLELLDLLIQVPRTVEDLADRAGMSVANASQHLQVLRRAGLVASQRRGVHVAYRLRDAQVAHFTVALRDLAGGRLGDYDWALTEFRTARQLDPVPADAILARALEGEVTVLDVRPAEEHAAGHLPGAVSVPLDRIEEYARRLPPDTEVVVYCRGPSCAMAPDAVARLRGFGIEAHWLDEGIADFHRRGIDIERGPEAA